jgi:hypothetical protein
MLQAVFDGESTANDIIGSFYIDPTSSVSHVGVFCLVQFFGTTTAIESEVSSDMFSVAAGREFMYSGWYFAAS